MTEDPHKQITLPGLTPFPVKEREEATPAQIGPYKIEGKLAKGGMSHLYLAVDPESQNTVVVKTLSPQYVNHPEMIGRFQREAEIIALAEHPNIVKLYGQGEWEKGLYIAMEFVQGISLRQFLLQHTMSLKRALEMVLQIIDAVQHLHSHGVIHRDLKPENILLTTSGGIKVIDFGIAQLHEQKEAVRPSTHLVGTPIYMAPEQKKDPRNVTATADVYSLGIITYELTLGRLSHGIIHIAQLPRTLQKILSKALQPKPKERYQSLKTLRTDIAQYLESGKAEKDQRGRAYTQDLAEHLQKAQKTLLPPHLPHWPHLSLGLASHRDLNISGVYYDFLELPDQKYAIILAEPSSRGVEGIIHAALLQGLMHALTHNLQDPTTLLETVNQRLAEHHLEDIFSLNLLILKPLQNELEYISCGYGPLWLVRTGTQHADIITSENIGLGIDPQATFLATKQKFHVGDTLYLATFRATEKNPEEFSQAILQSLYTTPQKQADALLRNLISDKTTLTQRPTTIIALERT